ncbi:DUF3892 domain-containing protein [Algoriphagus aquimarinus]|uniref:Uncharacterized protein n=1 Tax=Algoriphagus aquimarinus TaxID=237018 RepID=A0A1I0Y010_9BACT|nr:DUF3892 domain-containing protein [Algoriphagus aquimarinus]SFB06474.1 Protein of unknown function [Algoriphagus aquimarinus]
MTRLRIHFIERETRHTNSFSISQVGGINNTGERWMISAQKAITGINEGVWEFYILEDKKEVNVKVAHSENGEPNLVAIGMGYLHNLLEDLPEVSRAHSS